MIYWPFGGPTEQPMAFSLSGANRITRFHDEKGNFVDAGGLVITQDEATSVVWGMPGAAATAGVCTAVLPLDKVTDYVNEIILKRAA